MIEIIKNQIEKTLRAAGVEAEINLSAPPKQEMGDFAFPCFALAKEAKKNPAEVATEVAAKISEQSTDLFEKVQAFGPYVNFFLNSNALAKIVLEEIQKAGAAYGIHNVGKGKKYLVEFGCPNPLKAFHLGHLKNLITGESVVRVFENAGYQVVRVNYQGDVGMHVARALWGIFDWKEKFEEIKSQSLRERVEFLGAAYAHGTAHAEAGKTEEQEVVRYNDVVYENSDTKVMAVYSEARQWSLDYFDEIYKRLNSRFDKMYFESETFTRGLEIVKTGLKQGIFATGEGGAIIFEGSKYNLHDRVFINSKGFPTYEAKEMALAEKHFAEHNPDMVVHVVGKEQTEYFKVVIKALEFALPQTIGKEFHLVGGFLQLKGNQKMSSRQGNIVTGDQLIEEVEKRVGAIMRDGGRELSANTDDVMKKVSVAALKYGMLKNNVSQDVAFDLEESVSVAGDSGPYLLYIVARIKSILKKSLQPTKFKAVPSTVAPEEKQLLLKMAFYPEITKEAVETYDPSKIARYLFELAQGFTTFYESCPVLKAEEPIRDFRLAIITQVLMVMERGLDLLGIETVEEM